MEEVETRGGVQMVGLTAWRNCEKVAGEGLGKWRILDAIASCSWVFWDEKADSLPVEASRKPSSQCTQSTIRVSDYVTRDAEMTGSYGTRCLPPITRLDTHHQSNF